MKRGNKILTRQKRHWRVRKKVIGNPNKPRMCIFRSLKHLYVQLIDDLGGKTIVTCGTLSKDFRERFPEQKKNKKASAILGEIIAEKALKKGIKKIVFDRGGCKYHGRIQVLAEAARKKGLEF